MFNIKIQDYVNWKSAYRAYNGLMAGVSFYGYMNSPQVATFDEISSIALYAYEALAPDRLHELSMIANFVSIPLCYKRLDGYDLVTDLMKCLDLVNHLGIANYRMCSALSGQVVNDIKQNEGKVFTMLHNMKREKQQREVHIPQLTAQSEKRIRS